jgi:hypothetical protein
LDIPYLPHVVNFELPILKITFVLVEQEELEQVEKLFYLPDETSFLRDIENWLD